MPSRPRRGRRHPRDAGATVALVAKEETRHPHHAIATEPFTVTVAHPSCSLSRHIGRRLGQRPKSDRLAPKVLALVAQGRSYRLIGRELGLSKNTVAEIVKRDRAARSAKPG
jgi:hypothetical protein